jgi:hypothetical protein
VLGWGTDLTDSLAEDIAILRNARHAYIREYFGWANCGMKLGQGENITFRRWLVEGNYGHGAWLDTNIVNAELYDSVFINNTEAGIFLENNNRETVNNLGDRITVTVRENIFYENIAPAEDLAVDPSKFRTGKAIQFSEHENALVKNNLMYGNERVFHCSYNVRGPMENNVIRWNLVAAPSWAEDMGIYGGQLPAWHDFVDTLTNETDINYYFQDLDLPFIGRDLEPVDFEGYRDMLQKNLFNPFAHETMEAASVYTRADYPGTPLVVVSSNTAELTEGGVNVPAFRIKRLAPELASELVVNIGFRGQPGDALEEDFTGTLPTTVTIPAGEAFIYVEVSPLEDGLAEGPELFSIELLPGEDYLLGEPTSEVTLLDLDSPDMNQVSVQTLVNQVPESSGSVSAFRISRTGDISAALEVDYAIGGTAVAGSDYQSLSGLAVIAAESDHTNITVSVTDDEAAELLETITLVLQPAGAGEYVLKSPVDATLSLIDNDSVSPRVIDMEAGPADEPLLIPVTVSNPGIELMQYELLVPDGYQTRDSDSEQPAAFNWIEIAAPENKIGFQWIFPNDDGLSAALPLGLEFPFFGESFSSVYVHSNGFLTFTEQRQNFSTNRSLPDDDERAPSNLVAPFWRNLGLDAQSAVYAKQVGGIFVVQFHDMIAYPAFITKKRASFQVLLHANGIITFNYLSNDTGTGHTVGIQNGDKSEAVQIAYNENYVRPGLSLQLVPDTAWLRVSPDTASVPARGESDFTVTLDAELLPFGVWNSTLLFQSADPEEPVIGVPVIFEATPPTPVWAHALPVGGGSVFSGWFGYFDYYPESPGWINSLEHGLIYCIGDDSTSFWIHSFDLGWCWLSDSIYPYFYSIKHQSWVYYHAYDGAVFQRFFYVYDTEEWVTPNQF